MSERIQPVENREFNSGLGNWTGDTTWDPGPVGGKSGLMKFTCPIGSVPQIATLTYPFVKALKGKINDLTLALYFPSPISSVIRTFLGLTDGVYSYAIEWIYTITADVWLLAGLIQDLPSDWNEKNTTISFEAQNENTEERSFYADDASLAVETRVDHLPLLGIG